MTNNTSTFTPSTQILEAGEKESYFNPLMEIRPISPEDPDYQVFNEAHQIQNEPSWLESIIASLPDPIVHNLPEIIEIEPGSPEYQVFNEAHQIKDLSISSPFSNDGLTGTAPTMPAYDTVVDTIPETWEPNTNYEINVKVKKPSESMKEGAGILGAASGVATGTGVGAPLGALYGVAAGVSYLGGTIFGAFGLDEHESEPYIPEVGVDALA